MVWCGWPFQYHNSLSTGLSSLKVYGWNFSHHVTMKIILPSSSYSLVGNFGHPYHEKNFFSCTHGKISDRYKISCQCESGRSIIKTPSKISYNRFPIKPRTNERTNKQAHSIEPTANVGGSKNVMIFVLIFTRSYKLFLLLHTRTFSNTHRGYQRWIFRANCFFCFLGTGFYESF